MQHLLVSFVALLLAVLLVVFYIALNEWHLRTTLRDLQTASVLDPAAGVDGGCSIAPASPLLRPASTSTVHSIGGALVLLVTVVLAMCLWEAVDDLMFP